MDKIAVGILSLGGIFATYWYFLMKRENAVVATNNIDIVVDGGYSPSVISISQGRSIDISFLRKDPSTCLEEVVLSDFKIRKFLPLNKKTVIRITPQQKGEYKFSCGMNMFHGKIIVT